MSDINKPLVAFDIHGAIEQLVAKDNKIEQLEAENARLKGKVAQLEEAFDVKNRVHEKLNKDYLQLKAELAARDWQSADKLPTEEGEYIIACKDYRQFTFDLRRALHQISMWSGGEKDYFTKEPIKGIAELKDIKYLKLPDVEEK
jgi:uncharacterized protein YdcH (DUF465 family)